MTAPIITTDVLNKEQRRFESLLRTYRNEGEHSKREMAERMLAIIALARRGLATVDVPLMGRIRP